MTYEALMDVLRKSKFDQWLFDDERGTFTFKSDLNIRIQRQYDETSEGFNEPWATRHPDPRAERVYFELFYGNSLIKRVMMVYVDGFRAVLPLPKPGTDAVTADDYAFARNVDSAGTLDEYLKRSGLKVEGRVAA